MGVVSSDGVSEFWNRARVKFSGSGTTDGGLAFGGSFRAGEAADADNDQASKGSAFISGAFGKITMGSVDSGDAATVGQLASVGFSGLGYGNSIGYAADGGVLGLNDVDTGASARVLYTYSGNGLSVSASSSQLTDGGDSSYGVGVSYTTGALTVALGTGQVDGTFTDVARDTDAAVAAVELVDGTVSITDTSASATYVMGATTIKAIYQDKSATVVGDAVDVDADIDTSVTATSMGLSVSHKIDTITLTAYTVSTEIDAGDLTDDKPTVSRYGIGASYDLGGGASFAAGWAAVDTATYTADIDAGASITAATYTTETSNKFDMGLNFSF